MNSRHTLTLVGFVGFAATSLALKIEFPPETPGFKAAPGAEIALANCLMCHSSEYVTTQPPLSRAAWKASVEKMRAKYGAPIPAEQVEALVDYLTANYGSVPAPTPGK